MHLTKLGVELRKLRLELGMTLYDMAQKLNVSSSLLSSVETGRKPATDSFMNKLVEQFDVVKCRKDEFMRLAEETKTDVKIRLDHENVSARDVALAFARNFDKLNAQQLDQIMKVFNPARKGK
ncbi:MAG: helix-turn-helix transcriptional regulator [Zoogloeaceae bacterium]|jgi:transcriptional regulator with XRE-family HTH domain|nr:helix-turn-helix transcriptional regulator [Zoogloeaceae bacterium]